MKEETKCYCGHTTTCDCGPETLEEAINKYPLINQRIGFKLGAKWQQEQIGKSEFLQKLRGTLSDAEARRLIFEQFKNDRL
jgi:hypothetical protein